MNTPHQQDTAHQTPQRPQDTPHISHALFVETVRDRANAHLREHSGLVLRPVQTFEAGHSHTPHPLEVWDTKDQAPTGILLTPSRGVSPTPSSSNGLAVRTVGISVSEFGEEVQSHNGTTRALLLSISAAEDAAHHQVGNATRPEPTAMTHDANNLPGILKGRIAAARWHQDAGRDDGPIPPANAVRAIAFERKQQFRNSDGTFLRVPDGGTLLVDAQGTLSTPPEGHRIVPLMDVKPASTSKEAQNAAVLSVEARTAVRAVLQHDPQAPRLASVEHQGYGLVMAERADGVVMTLRAYASQAHAERGLQDQRPAFTKELDRENRQLSSVRTMVQAFRNDAR